jgi:hypothetical protein
VPRRVKPTSANYVRKIIFQVLDASLLPPCKSFSTISFINITIIIFVYSILARTAVIMKSGNTSSAENAHFYSSTILYPVEHGASRFRALKIVLRIRPRWYFFVARRPVIVQLLLNDC